MLTAGQLVDRYEVQALLGQGGMAAVYRVRHTQLEVDRALKVVTVGHPGLRQRLLLEGRVQASLSHPNLVGVTDVLEVGGQPGLLMEYVAGPTLQQWLASYTPSLEEALSLFRDIASGVGYAHASDLIHRDLKPANVLLLRRGNELVGKVADFGLAKVLVDELGEPGATRTGMGMGTPAYMAPEQIRDAKRVDQRGDIFALGCILYELTTGRQAFQGDDILSLLSSVAAGRFTSPRELVPDMPDAVASIINDCLVVDRDARIASCDALLDRLPYPAPFTWSEEALAAAVPPPEQSLDQDGSQGTWMAPGTLAPSPSGLGDSRPPNRADPTLAPGQAPATLPPTREIVPTPPPHQPSLPPADAGKRSTPWPLLLVGLVAVLTAGGLWANQRLALSERDSPATTPQPSVVAPEGEGEGEGKGEGEAALAAEATPEQTPPADEADEADAAAAPAEAAATQAAPEQAAPAAAAPASKPATSGSSGTSSTNSGTTSGTTSAPPPEEAPPAEPPAETGTVRVLGEAESVVLQGPGGSFPPGTVPVGTYDVIARFPGRDPASAGRVTITPGKEIVLRCRAAFVKCVP